MMPKADEGVYVSLDTLLNLRHSAHARTKNSVARVNSGLPGEIVSNEKGPGIEFEDIRPYMAGDDLRHIDWRVAARTGLPFTRLYTEDRERSVMIVCDQRVNMFFGSGDLFKSYRSVIAAARIAWVSAGQNHRISGVVASESLESVIASNPRQAVLKLCHSLVAHNHSISIKSQELISLDEMLDAVSNKTQPGMIVTIISDFYDVSSHTARVLAEIAKRGVLVMQRIADPLENEIAIGGRVGISDGNQVSQVVMSRQVRQAYGEQRALFEQRLESLVATSGATLIDDTEN